MMLLLLPLPSPPPTPLPHLPPVQGLPSVPQLGAAQGAALLERRCCSDSEVSLGRAARYPSQMCCGGCSLSCPPFMY